MIMTYTQNVKEKPEEMPDLSDYMTTEEAARALGLHIVTIRNMVRSGALEGLKVNRSVLIAKTSVDDYKRRTFGMSTHDPRRGQNKD
jgi:excisionase family DNA binding protein